MDLSSEHIRLILQTLIILILSIAVHEFGHAFVAHKLGDRLPKSQGRVTLNPAAHADPIGTLIFPLVGLILTKGASIGFGWGKPVQVNPTSFSRRFRMRTGHMFVAAAGPAMNILFAVFIATVHVTLVATGVIDPRTALSSAISSAVAINFVLCFFNLIPAPPLDGGAVIEGLLPDRMVPRYQEYSRYGPLVLFAVIFIPELQALFVTPALWLHGQLYSLLALFIS
jgi:Zn-dependent protease